MNDHALDQRFWIPLDRRTERDLLVLRWESPARYPAVKVSDTDFALMSEFLTLEPCGVENGKLKYRVLKGVRFDVFDVTDRKALKRTPQCAVGGLERDTIMQSTIVTPHF